MTRSAAQKLLEDGGVTLSGRPGKKNDRTAPGQPVTVSLPDPEPLDVLPQNIPLDVVYEDEDVIVAVSYTHLDVYKRQRIGRGPAPAGQNIIPPKSYSNRRAVRRAAE